MIQGVRDNGICLLRMGGAKYLRYDVVRVNVARGQALEYRVTQALL